jgi:hypothetical protein
LVDVISAGGILFPQSMIAKPKRPISVWISQIILGIYACFITMIVLWGLYKGLTDGIPNPQLYLVTNVGILTFVAVYLGGFWGMAIRRRWGRWLGVAGLTILLISAAIAQTSRWVSNRESSFVSISFLFSVFVVIGLAILTYMLAAGDAADDFFNGKSTKVRDPVDEDSGYRPREKDIEVGQVNRY